MASPHLPPPLPGRGTGRNPGNRFESRHCEAVPEEAGDAPAPRTRFLADRSRSIISTNRSPDVGFDASLNPYRGCEHGCIYCYARPTHEYLGFSAGLDFETRILVKEDAAALLREALGSPRWIPRTLAMSGVTDPYQPVEARRGITRRCLEVLAAFRNPVAIITKNRRILRDLDLLRRLAEVGAVSVTLSITTLDRGLQRIMEPRTSSPKGRLAAIGSLAAAGVPVGVNVAPVIPGLTDHELPAILTAAAEAGAGHAGFTVVRLPHGVASLFEGWLEDHFPDRKEKILSRLRSLRTGRLNDPEFGTRMRGEGPFADQVASLFGVTRRRLGLAAGPPPLSTASFDRTGGIPPAQGELFPLGG